MKIMQPREIGKYKVSFPIKKGVYAETYRVKDEKGDNYFLKLVNRAKLSKQQVEDTTNAITEFVLAKSLNHPNLAHTVETGEIVIEGQKYAYMVSDYIVGETVYDKLLREKHCTVYEVKQIITGALNGLKYLHRGDEPIIHNAIMPQNVMLDMSANTFVPIIIDFGHAQKLTADNTKFYTDGLNPFFLAPEVFRGVYSTRTDLYSVGAMMYNLLYGIVPWYVKLENVAKDDRVSAILEVRKSPLKIPNIKIFELDDNLLNIIAKATDQDVDKRFQSANEFLLALNEEITSLGSSYELVDIPKEKGTTTEGVEGIVKKGNGFADVAGMEDLKKRLQTEVIALFRNPEKYTKLRVKIPNGILLYGPPGCGKTFIAKKFAEELGCNYIYVHCSDVASPYIHGGQEKIATLFANAKKNAPTILFLDEIDALIADRSRHTNVSESGEVNEFLTQLNNCADNRILVIGATNNPKGIDPAALRSGRLDIKVYVPAPDAHSRTQLFELYLKDIAASNVDYKELAKKTNGYVSKDIAVLVNKAALITAQNDKELIEMDTLLSVIDSSRGELPSVPSAYMRQYESIRDEIEGINERKPIGFN